MLLDLNLWMMCEPYIYLMVTDLSCVLAGVVLNWFYRYWSLIFSSFEDIFYSKFMIPLLPLEYFLKKIIVDSFIEPLLFGVCNRCLFNTNNLVAGS